MQFCPSIFKPIIDRNPHCRMEELTNFQRIDARGCLAGKLRMINRIVTNSYNKVLRDHGIEVTVAQLNLLATISKMDKPRQVDVCMELGIEKSTLSRDLERLRVQNLVTRKAHPEGGPGYLILTERGLEYMDLMLPVWQKAQNEMKMAMGLEAVEAVNKLAALMKIKYLSPNPVM